MTKRISITIKSTYFVAEPLGNFKQIISHQQTVNWPLEWDFHVDHMLKSACVSLQSNWYLIAVESDMQKVSFNQRKSILLTCKL